MKLYTNVSNCEFIVEVADSIEVCKLGKLGKTSKQIRMQVQNDAIFNSIADKCDRGINQKLDRKMKRKQKYMGA